MNSRYPVPLAVTRGRRARPAAPRRALRPCSVRRPTRAKMASVLPVWRRSLSSPCAARNDTALQIAPTVRPRDSASRTVPATGSGFGFPPAAFERRRVAVRRDGQSAQRMHRPSARRGVPHFVPPFAARHDARAEGRGEKRRLPVREIVQQDEINRFPVHRVSCFVRPPSCGGRMCCPYSPPQTSRDVPEKVSAAASMSCSAVRARMLA